MTVLTAGAAAMAMAGTLSGATLGGVMAAGGAVFSGGVVAGAVAGTTLSAAGMVGAAVIGGAVGSIASQGVAIAAGLQESFSWKQVGLSALGSGVTAGLGQAGMFSRLAEYGKYAEVAATAATSNAITQGLAVATDLQEHFNWRAVATSAMAAPVAQYLGGKAGGFVQGMVGGSAGQMAGEFAQRFTAGVVSQRIRMAVYNQGKLDYASIAADAFGNALGDGIVGAMQRGPEVHLPDAVAKEAESNPAMAALYRKTVENFRAGGVANDKAQELALRGFDLRSSGDNAQALDAYKLDVLMAKGASADSAKALLNYMGLSTGQPEPVSVPLSVGDYATVPDFVLPTVTVTGGQGSGLSGTGRFLSDWQDELAAVGTASQKLGQWMDDHPALGWGLMAVQAATTPLLFAGQQALEHSPIGERLNTLTGAAFEAASDYVDSEGAIGDKGKAALMTIGGISALSLAVGGLGMLRRTVSEAGTFAKALERRRIEMNFDRDGGIDPHVVDPRVLAQQRLGQMQQQFTPLMARGDAHFLDKHGPQTTLTQQYERASTGGWPDPAGTRPSDASRFFNPEDMEVAIRRAMAQYSGNPDVPVVVQMGKPIGEGFVKVGRSNAGTLPEYRQSDAVRVIFDRSGLPKTAYPDIVRNGVVLPPPNF